MSDEPTTTRPQSRFSLLTLFLLTIVSVLVMTVLLFWSEVGPLRERVARMEAELGRLHVTDSERPHVIAVRTDEPLTWKWRVYLPPLPFGKYHFNCYEGLYQTFTAENVIQLLDGLRRRSPNYEFWSNNGVIPSGELTIEAKLVNRDGQWFLQLPPFGERRLILPDELKAMRKDVGLPEQEPAENPWTDKAEEFAGVNSKRQMVFGRGDAVPLLLLQGPPVPFRSSKSPERPAQPMSSTLMLWIDNTP